MLYLQGWPGFHNIVVLKLGGGGGSGDITVPLGVRQTVTAPHLESEPAGLGGVWGGGGNLLF